MIELYVHVYTRWLVCVQTEHCNKSKTACLVVYMYITVPIKHRQLASQDVMHITLTDKLARYNNKQNANKQTNKQTNRISPLCSRAEMFSCISL